MQDTFGVNKTKGRYLMNRTQIPDVSFVVPVFNVATSVSECLDSLLSQTVANIEIIAVDDGSTDASGLVCDETAKRDSRLSVVHTVNRGVSHARNLGLLRAVSEHVCFVDSDDWVSPFYAERMLQFMKESGAPIVACGPTRVDSDGHVLWRKSPRRMVLQNEAAICATLRRDLYCGWPWNKMFKRRLLLEHDIRFDESLQYCEDLVFCFDAIRHASHVYYDSCEDLYYYCARGASANDRTILNGQFNSAYLNRLEADAMILERARTISRRVTRYAEANAFVSNESIFRKLRSVGSPSQDLSRIIARNMGRLLPAVLGCRGFGGLREKERFVWETFLALSGRIPTHR